MATSHAPPDGGGTRTVSARWISSTTEAALRIMNASIRTAVVASLLLFSTFGCRPSERGGSGLDFLGPIDPDLANPTHDPDATPTGTPTTSTYPQPCHPLYAQDIVPAYSLTIDNSHLSRLRANHLDKTWRPAVFTYEGESREVMVKNRGNGTCGKKLQLAIAFNRVDPEGRFEGFRRLVVDHGNCRIFDERLSLAFVRDELGEVAPCANHATLHVNGEYEGLYSNLEAMNKDFLNRAFGPEMDDGNFWEEGNQLETNEETGTDEVLLAYKGSDSVSELEDLSDVEHSVRYWAMEAIIPATDNFFVDGWNYFLYEHPERGIIYVPRDYDKATPWSERFVTLDPMEFSAAHHPIPIVLSDAEYRDLYVRTLHDVLDRYDPAKFKERQDLWWEQIRAFAIADESLGLSEGEAPRYVPDNVRDRVLWLEANLPPRPD